MDVAVHAIASVHDGSGVAGVMNRSLIRAYGLRPDLFAVANVIVRETRETRAYAKGALEAISELCRLPPERLAVIRSQVDTLAARGVRVLGVARSSVIEITQVESLLAPRRIPRLWNAPRSNP